MRSGPSSRGSADPGGSTKFVSEWDVPQVLVRGPDGTPAYQLDWWRVVGNRADQLTLEVHLPKGWSWAADPPPETIALSADFTLTVPIDGAEDVDLSD